MTKQKRIPLVIVACDPHTGERNLIDKDGHHIPDGGQMTIFYKRENADIVRDHYLTQAATEEAHETGYPYDDIYESHARQCAIIPSRRMCDVPAYEANPFAPDMQTLFGKGE